MRPDTLWIVLGAPYNDGNGDISGHVRVYSWNEEIDRYTQQGSDIDGKAANYYFGCSVSLSDNGDILAIGAIHSTLRAQVYEREL
jgi:hypothetical protein